MTALRVSGTARSPRPVTHWPEPGGLRKPDYRLH